MRKPGGQVRITAQLIDARSDIHLWSEVYEKEVEDVFPIHDEISAAIVESMRDTIDFEVDESLTTTAAMDTQAHDAYLRGRYLLAQRYVGGAVRDFQRAISLDPDYALVHAELAIAYRLGYLYISDTEAAASAAPHVEIALALDPSIAEAHAAAGVSSWNGGDVQEALRHFEKALRLNPNAAGVHRVTGTRSSGPGRVAEAGAVAGDPA